MKELNDFVKKAEKFLKTAELALNEDDFDSCVSRCYYAMFFVTEAVLFSKGIKTSTHKGVISLFGEHFVKSGIFNRELGKSLNDVYDKRLVGDYSVGITITKEEANQTLTSAKNFVKEISRYLVEKEM